MLSWYKRYRRRRLLARPYPAAWEPLLSRNLAHYRRMTEDEQARLRDITRVLVAEKVWEGCGGLQITEEMQVTIAAQAAMILLGLAHDYFSDVLSILVYPSAFELPQQDDLGHEMGGGLDVAGQAVYRGPVILAWDAALEESRDPTAGHNVVVHEFAHHLDFLDGYTNGTPPLRDEAQNARWREVMTTEYAQLQRALGRGRATFLGEQAGWNEGEFFAAASERFFVRPDRLRLLHPPLYEVLASYYGVEPIRWLGEIEAS
jgi:Mlc titration factor MtfA (ptsG expression regulator)